MKRPKAPAILCRLTLLLMLFAMTPRAMAQQQINVSGIVTDPSGEPIIGASVIAGDSGNGTATNIDGEYTIKADPLGEIRFSYIGYTPQSVSVDGRNTINVTLEENASVLDEVVVIGYGTLKKSDLTGAVSSLGAKDIKEVPVNNVGQAIQGKIAGVNIVGGNKPGDNVTIKVRGLGSIINCDPLVVIDGVPTDLGLNSLNPQDIERLDVLKDASATAIYGSRGANGVVMITTRKGVSGTAKLSVSVNAAFSNASKTMKLLDAAGYAALSNDMLSQAGHNTNPDWADPSTLTQSTNWVDELLQTGVMQNYNVSYSGGTDKAHYYFSAGFLDQSGIVRNVNYRRFTFQSNNDVKLKSWLKLSNNLLFSADIKNSGSYSMWDAMQALPTFPVKTDDGQWSGPSGNSEWYGSVRNPIGVNEMNQSSTNGYNLLANIAADVTFTPWLQFRSLFGFDGKFFFDEAFTPKYDWKPTPVEESTQYQSSNRNFTYLWDNYFTFDYTFANKHSLNVMAGMSAQWNHAYWMNGQMNGFLFDNVHQLENGEKINDLAGSQNEWALLSYMARANYSYDNRYLLTATVRRDGTSRFAKENRWGTYPAVAVGWRIIDENFMEGARSWMNDLKLRFDYGITGQQGLNDDFFPYLPTYYTSTNLNGRYPLADGTWVFPYTPNKYNADLKWESTTTYNVGIDFGFLNNRINGSIEYYVRKTKDLLVEANYPAGSNLSNVGIINGGDLENSGFEFNINTKPVVTNDFIWTSNLNIAYNRNKITRLADGYDGSVGDIGDAIRVQKHVVGQPAYSFYVYEQVYNADGTPLEGVYVDQNGDGIINKEDLIQYHSPTPTVTATWVNNFQYKNWDLGFTLRGNFDNWVYNNTESGGVFPNTALAATPVSNIRADRYLFQSSRTEEMRLSNYFVQNASFVRCDNITLGYTWQNLLQNKLKLRLYAAVQNPFVITKYKGLDPEVTFSNGIDNNPYPRPVQVSLGVVANF